VAVDVNSEGKVNFDAIVKQGTNRNKTVFSKMSDLKVRCQPDGSTRAVGGLSARLVRQCSCGNTFRSLCDEQEKEGDEDVLAKPTAEEEAEATAKTKAKLEALIGGKVAAARPVQVAKTPGVSAPMHARTCATTLL
jgi:SNW domain-containing protein 1